MLKYVKVSYGVEWFSLVWYAILWYDSKSMVGMVLYVVSTYKWQASQGMMTYHGMGWNYILWYNFMVCYLCYSMLHYVMSCYAMHCYGTVWCIIVYYSLFCYGFIWHGLAWYCMVYCIMVFMVWNGVVRIVYSNLEYYCKYKQFIVI